MSKTTKTPAEIAASLSPAQMRVLRGAPLFPGHNNAAHDLVAMGLMDESGRAVVTLTVSALGEAVLAADLATTKTPR